MTANHLLRPCPRCGRSYGIINCPICMKRKDSLKELFKQEQGEEQGSDPSSDDRSS